MSALALAPWWRSPGLPRPGSCSQAFVLLGQERVGGGADGRLARGASSLVAKPMTRATSLRTFSAGRNEHEQVGRVPVEVLRQPVLRLGQGVADLRAAGLGRVDAPIAERGHQGCATRGGSGRGGCRCRRGAVVRAGVPVGAAREGADPAGAGFEAWARPGAADARTDATDRTPAARPRGREAKIMRRDSLPRMVKNSSARHAKKPGPLSDTMRGPARKTRRGPQKIRKSLWVNAGTATAGRRRRPA